jgi:hypothetical protein
MQSLHMSSEIILPHEPHSLLLRVFACLNWTIESLKILGGFRMPRSDVAIEIFAELEASAGTMENGATEGASMCFGIAAELFGAVLTLSARRRKSQD